MYFKQALVGSCSEAPLDWICKHSNLIVNSGKLIMRNRFVKYTKYKTIIFLVSIFVFPSNSKGQIQADSVMKKIEKVGTYLLYRNHDTTYIKSYADKFGLKLVAVNKYNYFTLIDKNTNNRLRYRPELGINLGLGIAYKWFAFDLVFNFGIRENQYFTNEDFFDFQGKIFSSKQYIEATLQYYYGYQTDNMSEISEDAKVRKDIRTINYGLQYLHAFNYDKFSIKAPFILNDHQRKSAGSVIGGFGFSLNIMDADSSVIPQELSNDFSEKLHLRDLNTINLTANAGYMYSFVYKEHFFLTLGLIPGLTISYGDYWTHERQRLKLNLSYNIKTMNAIGYNGEKIYGGFQLVSDALYIKIDKKNYTQTSHGKLSLFIGYRFTRKNK